MKNGVVRLTGTVSIGPWRLEAAVLARTIQFSSCGEAGFAHVLLSAMRFESSSAGTWKSRTLPVLKGEWSRAAIDIPLLWAVDPSDVGGGRHVGNRRSEGVFCAKGFERNAFCNQSARGTVTTRCS